MDFPCVRTSLLAPGSFVFFSYFVGTLCRLNSFERLLTNMSGVLFAISIVISKVLEKVNVFVSAKIF